MWRVQELLPSLQQWPVWMPRAGGASSTVCVIPGGGWTLSSSDDLTKLFFSWRLVFVSWSIPPPLCLQCVKWCFIFCADKNVFGSENLVYLPKLDFFPLLCPQETCSSLWNVMDPLTIFFSIRAQRCSLELCCFSKNNSVINHKAVG